MCGLFALFGSSIEIGVIRAATDVIAHRGPDDEGAVFLGRESSELRIFGGADTPASVYSASLPYSPTQVYDGVGFPADVALAHRRLSIVDLSPAGHQPMSTEDQRYWIVYNGEVYNHIEIRRELEQLGCTFVSGSDTEVILKAYRQWGRECLHRFNGMFAFVIVDRGLRKAFVARDRFGVKPLYWWRDPKGFLAFASEIKQFTVLPGWQAVLNRARAYDFLNWGVFDHTDETLFSDVHQLRGGEFFEFDFPLPTFPRPQRWYEFPAIPLTENPVVEFRTLFADSVRLRLRSDVPVGSCLSGGLDSSAIVCVASDLLRAGGGGAGQQTFTACANERRYDERDFAACVVEATGAQPHYLYPQAEGVLEELDVLTWHQDEPFGSTSIYAQWSVFRAASSAGVKVVLDGQGADEQLAGYHSYFSAYLAQLVAEGRFQTLSREMAALSKSHGYGATFLAKALLNRLLPSEPLQWLRRRSGGDAARPDWLDLDRLGVDASDPFGASRTMANGVASLGRDQMLRTHLPMLLHWEDRDSMAHSVESRVPFLDYRLAEFLAGVPADFKIRDGATKFLLREAMRGILPESVRTRRDKMGFVTPEEVWVRQTHTNWFRMRIADCISRADGILRASAHAQFERIVDGSVPFSFLPWRLVSFGAWLDRFAVKV